MTDNEIIKALECCPKAEMAVDCEKLGCPMLQKGGCAYVVHSDIDSDTDVVLEGLTTDALDLINRQKAEIERLGKEVDRLSQCVLYHEGHISDAIKEFAERLKEHKIDVDVSFGYGKEVYTEAVAVIEIDNLVKEMVGRGWMKKTEMYCDRCGERIVNTKGCYNQNYALRDDSAKITLWGVGENRSTFDQRIDLCVRCFEAFVSFLERGDNNAE